ARRGVNRRWVGLYNRQVVPRLGLVPKARPVPLFFVELTNHCNLECSMCPRPTLQRELGHMDWDLYCRIIDNIARLGGRRLGLNRFGESLLYPRFLDAVRYAKKAGIRHVSVVTNGTLLDGEMASEILDSGLDHIAVSLDTLDRDAYEEMRRGARLDEVVANLDRFIEMRRQRGAARPQIQINSVLVEEDLDQIRALFEKYQAHVDRIFLKPCARYGEGQDLSGDGVSRRRWLTCIQPWQRLNIFWDGEATVCCGDVEGDLVVGNVKQASLEWLWLKSPRASDIRRLHHRQEFDTLPVCRRCDATNADFFEQAVEQLKRLYTAVGMGDRILGLQNTMPLLRWHAQRGDVKVAQAAPDASIPEELEP
ncbi:MAG: radical SAM protein, partial [Armatimonadota bacterium]|nr:radical SAM protein [Armatimonadota bacterium]